MRRSRKIRHTRGSQKKAYPTPQLDLRWKKMHCYENDEKWERIWELRGCCLEQKEKRNSQGRDPKTLERNSQERTREPLKKKKKNVKKKKVMYIRRSLWQKMQRKDRKFLHGREERRRGGKERQEERHTSQSETSLGEVWKMALSPSAGGAELVVCQCWCCQQGQVGCAAERSVELERTCQDTSQEIQMLNERPEIF